MIGIDLGTIFEPRGPIAWLIVGLVAGFLASVFIKGRSSGCIVNIIVGLVGSVIGGLLANLLDLGQFGFVPTIVVSFIGACILLIILRYFTGAKR